ncbi:DNA gyrase subunit A, partial [bacterium]|nr:DNA gyrase subunit A [bacterium]
EEVRRNGKIAMRLDDGDQLIAARLASNESHVLMVSSAGQAIRFKIDDLREASRTSGGVRGMRLAKGGYIVCVETIDPETTVQQLLTITQNGFGKRTAVAEYPLQGRGGQGVKTLNITDKTGNVAACRIVEPGQELMLVSRDGIVIRTRVDSISLLGRNTQGVTVMRVGEGDEVASIAAFTMKGPAAPAALNGASANGHAELEEGDTIPLNLDEETGELLDDEDVRSDD